MEPKTKFQKLVTGLKSKLRPVTPEQIRWGLENCFEYSGTISKNKAGCLECGHSWGEKYSLLISVGGCTCPECGKELKMKVTRKKSHDEVSYFAILTTVGDFQVIRMLYLTKYCKIGTTAQLRCSEVMQHWINGKGESLVFSKLVNGFSNYYDNWILSSGMELRGTVSNSSNLRNSIRPYKIHPKRKILDVIRRNGFKGSFYGIPPIHLFDLILNDSKAETILKAHQGSLLKFYYDHLSYQRQFDKHWPSVKICLRNGYKISDATVWMDYLDLLQFFNKDLLNSYYVCPVNLKVSHDLLVQKKRRILEKRRQQQENRQLEREKWDLLNAPIKYQEEKGKFFGLSFSDGKFTVKVLESVEEFKQEGDILQHCVYVNKYYSEPDSLVLSARIGDQPIETVEISLSSMKIIQARGLKNNTTKHHDAIINLVESNLHKIRKLLK